MSLVVIYLCTPYLLVLEEGCTIFNNENEWFCVIKPFFFKEEKVMYLNFWL